PSILKSSIQRSENHPSHRSTPKTTSLPRTPHSTTRHIRQFSNNLSAQNTFHVTDPLLLFSFPLYPFHFPRNSQWLPKLRKSPPRRSRPRRRNQPSPRRLRRRRSRRQGRSFPRKAGPAPETRRRSA
ncbi:hypothetical protein CFP56_023573, partial [Quercus suber]